MSARGPVVSTISLRFADGRANDPRLADLALLMTKAGLSVRPCRRPDGSLAPHDILYVYVDAFWLPVAHAIARAGLRKKVEVELVGWTRRRVNGEPLERIHEPPAVLIT